MSDLRERAERLTKAYYAEEWLGHSPEELELISRIAAELQAVHDEARRAALEEAAAACGRMRGHLNHGLFAQLVRALAAPSSQEESHAD